MLDRIVADNIVELAEKKRRIPLEEMAEQAQAQLPPLDFASALRGEGVRIIAEVKQASPSKGIIRKDFHPVAIARVYAANGAAAISVLTEPRYFRGSLNYLKDIAGALGDRRPPLLRKDFIVETYQVYESRAYRADAILLIAAILDGEKLKSLLDLAHSLSMAGLVEVHSEKEVAVAVEAGARIIGINNRNLATFQVDLSVTERLRPLIHKDRIVVSESGIKGRADIERLRGLGVNAVLIGEAFMAAPDIGAKMSELLHG